MARPSFYFKLHESRRIDAKLRQLGARESVWHTNPKSAAYEFAASHGLRVPTILRTYNAPSAIDWADLPDEFTLKTDNGTGALGVLPLERCGDTFRDLLDGDSAPVSGDDVCTILKRRRKAGEISGQLLVEELLRSPYPGHEGPALDIKLYCFYGVVGMLMVRDANGSRNSANLRVRYFDPDGADLGDAMQHLTLDPSLPCPMFVPQLVEAAQRLSAALPCPFVRLDFFEQQDGIVFGEVTPRPGGRQLARPDVDERLGELWQDAEARLLAENIETRAPRFGDRLTAT